MILALSVLAVAGLVAVLFAACRRGRLLLVCGAILTVLAAGWVAAFLAVRAGYRDADGFVDCRPFCTAFQEAVGPTLVYGPVAALVVLAAALVLARRRPRSPT